MPRVIDPILRDCLERANPYTRQIVELAVPDVSNVLRRPDQFVGTGSALVAGTMSPSNSLSSSVNAGLSLSASTSAIASYTGEQSYYDLNQEDPSRRLKGVSWQVDPAFGRGVLKAFTARIKRNPVAGVLYFNTDFQLQVYRVLKTPGVKTQGDPGTSGYSATAFTDYQFTPILSSAPVIKAADITWSSNKATLSFDLSQFGAIVESTPNVAANPDQAGELPKCYFVVTAATPPVGNGYNSWLTDTAASPTVANVGTFHRVFWARDNDQQQWVENASYGDVPACSVSVESYPTSGQGVFALDLLDAPKSTSTGRVHFERSLPSGTAVTLELATVGSTGPWTAMTDGAVVSIAQQHYWLRLTLTSDSTHRSSPGVLAAGVEFATPIDVSLESIIGFPTRQVDLPYPKAAVAEGDLTVIRTGLRDYLDVAGTIASEYSTTQIEANIYLASDHPLVDRSKWLRLERLRISTRTPTGTSEKFNTMSYASLLKKKIPAQTESISSVHTVVSSTAAQVQVSPNLPVATPTGNEYDGQNYYVRVRSTSKTIFPPNYQQTIQGNTGVDRLDFVPSLPDALVAGDVIEVHSGVFAPVSLEWIDQDLADVWANILDLRGIPKERIGLGYLPRGGLPPRVTDWAPGDSARQAALKASFKVTDLTVTQDLLDQVSYIMGGATIEIDGQIVFVQLYPLRAADGTVTVPLGPVSHVFDIRDLSGDPDTPPGYDKRAPLITTKYGKDTTAADPGLLPDRQTAVVDADALAWLDAQELEDLGNSAIPDDVSRWFFNSADAGLTLATAVADMCVRATSTGLKRFTLPMVEAHFDVVPGDCIVLVQDQYTDYDPSAELAIRGARAIRGVLVSVGPEGRTLSMFVPGLTDNILNVVGGAAGAPIAVAESITPGKPALSDRIDHATGVTDVLFDGDELANETRVVIRTDRAPTPSEALAGASGGVGVQKGACLAVATIPVDTKFWIGGVSLNRFGEVGELNVVTSAFLGVNTSSAPTLSFGTAVVQANQIAWPVTFGIAAVKGMFFVEYDDADPDSSTTAGKDVEYSASGIFATYDVGEAAVVDGVLLLIVPIRKSSTFVTVTGVPIDALNQRGPKASVKSHGPSSAPSKPNAPSIAPGTATSNTLPVTVTFPSSGTAAAKIRPYLDGAPLADVAIGTWAYNGSQSYVFAAPSLTPGSSHLLTASLVTSGGVEGSKPATISMMCAADTSGGGSGTGMNGKLPDPVASGGEYNPSDKVASLAFGFGSGTPSGMRVSVWSCATIGGTYARTSATGAATPALASADQTYYGQTVFYYKLTAYDPLGVYTESDLSSAITVTVTGGLF